MSVSWQNQRRGQSLVAHGRVKMQQKNRMFLKLRLNELTDGEMQIFRGMALWSSITESATIFDAPALCKIIIITNNY